jgi:hypothetical protein
MYLCNGFSIRLRLDGCWLRERFLDLAGFSLLDLPHVLGCWLFPLRLHFFRGRYVFNENVLSESVVSQTVNVRGKVHRVMAVGLFDVFGRTLRLARYSLTVLLLFV